jgi:hypothetical protein
VLIANPNKLQCTAKILYQKFEIYIPGKETARPQSQSNSFIHVSVCDIDIYIPSIGLSILLQENSVSIVGIYKLLTDTLMWKLGLRPHRFFSGNT